MLNDDENDTICACDKCFTFLAQYNTKLAKTWLILISCATCNPKNLVFGSANNKTAFMMLEFLEKNGFILSTEIDISRLVIKVLGFNIQEDIFCVKKHDLDENED